MPKPPHSPEQTADAYSGCLFTVTRAPVASVTRAAPNNWPAVHAPGLNWVELSERLQSRVGAFILLADHYDAELSADFEGEGRFVVAKPLQEADLERVLKAMDLVVSVRSGDA